MTDKKTSIIVQCPNCNKSIPWNETQKWKPFCSEQCKLIDLGDWISEKHHIPGDNHFTDEDEI